ncbi:MAG TPA: hypothetical protein VGR93_11750 [Candidatus Acidoferrales bacterium]|nr:hypothetical protein [Candidatus Acidoferrales bacterium]
MAQAASTYLGEQRRRSTRLDQTSPVIIRGVDLLGQPFEERTATQNLGFQGCRYASKHHLPKNTWVTLEVPSGDSRKEAVCVRVRVAWIQRPRTLRELFQVGVEMEKGKNIWNVAFPPNDWTSERPAGLSVVAGSVPSNQPTESEFSLEDYLRMAMESPRHASTSPDEKVEVRDDGDAAIEQLRQEFLKQSEKMIAEVRATAEDLVRARTSELQDTLQSSQQASAKEFYEQWLTEFDRDRADTKREITSAVSEDVATRLTKFQEQVRDTLTTEWAEKLSRAQVEFSKWESDAQSLRNEVRASAEATLSRSDELLNEKLKEIRRELEASLKASAVDAAETSASANPAAEAVREDLSKEIENARGQWSELLETSLDGAAARLAERMATSSQELLRKAEQELAGRVAELQKESGMAAETSRAALDELKIVIDREISQAKNSLKEIEQSATNYSEYSRQLEAASRDSLTELRERLASAAMQQCVEMEKRAAELEEKFMERMNLLLEQHSRQTVQRSAQEIESRATVAVETAARAAEELAKREEQAENILQIHRERLRQVSEQIQREAAARFDASLSNLQDELRHAREEALKPWSEELAGKIVEARQEAAAALENDSARKLDEVVAQLESRAQHTVNSAQENMNQAMETVCGELRVRLEESEAREVEKAREVLARSASEQLDMAKSEFMKAAETAASELGKLIAESGTTALADFSAASDVKAEQAAERLAAAGESVLQSVQNHAQTSFEHFQEQLAIKTEQAIRQAGETLTHQFDAKIEKLRGEGEAAMEEWSTRQRALSERALETNREEMRAAANSTIDSALERLDQCSEERINAATKATERVVRQACADVFETVAQKMKEQAQGVAEIRRSSPAEEMNEHHASA